MKLVEIQPRELNFKFEKKIQSSCAIHLANLSDQYVAFKVKTTSPKRYCVRPNISIIKPKSTCEITVTTQAQRSAPQCKDKFLIQSTVVPIGTTEDDISPDMFSKDLAKCIEQCKLKVILTGLPYSPALRTVNGDPRQELPDEASIRKEQLLTGAENLLPSLMNSVDPISLEGGNGNQITAKKAQWSYHKDVQSMPEKNVEEDDLKLSKDMKELNSKLRKLNSKLIEAENILVKLKDENCSMNQEKQTLKQELAMLRNKDSIRRVQIGFPPLFVCTVALVGLAIGSYLAT